MNSKGEVITHTCECGHVHRVSEREIALYQGMVVALLRTFKWCKEKGRHEFQMKDVRDFIGKIEYTRFGDWKKFGGMVYSPRGVGKGHYGLNMERCDAFFKGELTIPTKVWKNPVTKELRPGEYRSIRAIPKLMELLDTDGFYIANYREAQGTLL